MLKSPEPIVDRDQYQTNRPAGPGPSSLPAASASEFNGTTPLDLSSSPIAPTLVPAPAPAPRCGRMEAAQTAQHATPDPSTTSNPPSNGGNTSIASSSSSTAGRASLSVSSTSTPRHVLSRPPSVADISPDASTPLQRHFYHQRHQSSTDLRPSSALLQHQPNARPSSPSPSPATPDGGQKKKNRPRSVNMPFTGDHRQGYVPETPRGTFSSWASPIEAARSWGASSTPGSNDATPSRTRKQTAPSSSLSTPHNAGTVSPGSANTSRFAFLSSSLSTLTTKVGRSPASPSQADSTRGIHDSSVDSELLNLNVQEALFPSSTPSPSLDGPASPSTRDPFSPASYKNLEMAATALLTRYQTAYRRQAVDLRALKEERDTRADAMEETETRTRHLKMQLEDMARQAAEREEEMQKLAAALEKERSESQHQGGATAALSSEDLGAEEDQKQRRRRWRRRERKQQQQGEEGDVGSDGDSSAGEEEESDPAPSVFSRSRSPTLSTTVSNTTEAHGATLVVEPSNASASNSASPAPPATPSQLQPKDAGTPRTGTPKARHQQQQQQQQQQAQQAQQAQQSPSQFGGALQKFVKGFTAGNEGGGAATVATCRNCQGQDQQVAWDTVGLLKDENRSLKERVAELEGCIECALDVVNGIRV